MTKTTDMSKNDKNTPLVFREELEKNGRAAYGSFVFWSVLGLVLVGIDQLTKHLAVSGGFADGLNMLQPVIGKENFRNFRFAFSLPVPAPVMFTVYGAALILIFRHVFTHWTRLPVRARAAWVLVMAGALSNVGERIALGYVRDFIYILTGVFNLADGYILAGVVMLLFHGAKGDAQGSSSEATK